MTPTSVPTLSNRIQLAEYFAELGFKKGAEIGVCTGRYSRILCEKIPGLQLIGVDPYIPYGGYGDFRRQSTHDDNYRQTRENLKDYPNYLLIVAFSTQAAKLIPDGSLDFVFIDANHAYEPVKEDIHAWAPKVRSGGIVSGHDYYEFKSGKGGVVQAVDEYAAEHGLTVHATLWDETGNRDDRQPDWFFFQP